MNGRISVIIHKQGTVQNLHALGKVLIMKDEK